LDHRGDACAIKLISKVDSKTWSFVTDEWGGFFRLLPEERHFPGKDITFPIEGTNSDIRHSLARFHRRSKVTSRSKDMVEAPLLLFHHLQSEEILYSLLAPYYRPLVKCLKNLKANKKIRIILLNKKLKLLLHA